MASKISIANQALSWVGASLITSFSDESTEAAIISANYDGVRDAVLEDRAWTFATRRVSLTPVLTPPDFGYSYQFAVPADCLRVLTVRNDRQAQGPNHLDWAREMGRILCDSDKIYMKYLSRVDDPLQYSPGFVQCMAARLAADIAIPLAGSRSLQSDMWGLYQKKLADAKTLDGMQGRAQDVGKHRFVAVRGAAGGGSAVGPVV